MSPEDFPKELSGVYRALCTYFGVHKNDLSIADLAALFFSTRPKDREYYEAVFENLDKIEVQETAVAELISSVQQGKILRDLSLRAYDVAEGRGNLTSVLDMLGALQTTSVNVDEDFEEDFVTDDLQAIADRTVNAPGLRWRLNTLNLMLGSLRKGNFGFIFARPETGKTTFLASEVTFMAQNLPPDAGPILWFNNEQVGEEVMSTIYRAALGVDSLTLFRDIQGNQKRYKELIGGRIKVKDEASISKQYVEKMAARYKPSLIIFDQIDKITGFQNDREDLRLGAIYIWARELAKKYCPVIGVCQADGTGENVRWLTMQHVANAKTSKQAEADWILGIGKIHDIGHDNIRFLHLSKNKLQGDPDTLPDMRHGRKQVLIDPNIARYGDM